MDPDHSSRKPVVLTRKMAHDLMNHLTVALGNSELMRMDLPEDDPSRPAIAEIVTACQNAIRLVQGWMAAETDKE